MHATRNGKMPEHREYLAGWLNSSIPEFLEGFPRNSRSTAFALLTCLDSEPDLTSLVSKSPELAAALEGAKPVGNGLLLPSPRLHEASFRDRVFFGFDEVWFFPSDPVRPKPDETSIVGPQRIDPVKLAKLVPWMAETRCSLALGDGAGLNIITKAHGLVRWLVAQSICQPEPPCQTSALLKEDTGEP